MRKIVLILLIISLMLVSCTVNNPIPAAEEANKENAETEVKGDEYDERYQYTETVMKPVEFKITNRPNPSAMLADRGKLEGIPKYDASNLNAFAVDFRGYDLSHLEIGEDSIAALMVSSFNTATKWPEKLPEGFKPSEIMELGKNPGLNVRELHKRGITGKGIGIAIIDQRLLVDHIEYREQLKFYEEINCIEEQAAMHGAAVASIAVGNTVGVAPGADLYYIAETHGESKDGVFEYDFTWLAMSIDRILEVNKALPADRKIRVISISVGWSSEQKGYKETVAAVNRAKAEGIFVVSSSLEETYGLNFHGIGRSWYDNPDDYAIYIPGYWWGSSFYNNPDNYLFRRLLIPMDGRTTASPIGNEGYVYYPRGGWSWSIPYIAGLYALACQVDEHITPGEFWEVALKTGDTSELERDGKTYKLEKIVNPIRLIELLQQE